jgi:hypothetical protein
MIERVHRVSQCERFFQSGFEQDEHVVAYAVYAPELFLFYLPYLARSLEYITAKLNAISVRNQLLGRK